MVSRLQDPVILRSSLVVVVVPVVTTFIYQNYFKQNDKIVLNEDEQIIELLLGEEKGLIHSPSIATITFFDGDIDDHGRGSKGIIRNRVLEILQANPWLTSRLIKYKNSHTNQTQLGAKFHRLLRIPKLLCTTLSMWLNQQS